MINLQQTISRLQQTNEKGIYLAVLRIAASLWFLKELILRWPALEILYSSKSFLNIPPDPSLSNFGISAVFLKENHMLVIYAALLLLLLNLFGIGRNLTSFLVFIVFALIYNMNNRYTNGGDKMSVILLFYLSFANTFSHLTLFKRKPLADKKEKLYNLLSNLAAYSIIINLCLVYFIAGLAKLMNPLWQHGTAMYYFLNDERFSVFAAGGKTADLPAALLYIVDYGTILLELAFPFLMLNKKTRNIGLILCFIMHLGIYSFMMIYSMTVMFVIQYGMFYSNEEISGLLKKLKALFAKLFRFTGK